MSPSLTYIFVSSPPAYQPGQTPASYPGYDSVTTPLKGQRSQRTKRDRTLILIVFILVPTIFLISLGLYFQWEREEEKRESLGLYWAEPEGSAHCSAYNTRDYKARLLNTLPYNYNWLKPCQEKPITIHDKSIRTTRCEIKVDVSPSSSSADRTKYCH